MSQLTSMILELPTELLQETEQVINSGKYQGINELIIRALKLELLRLKRDQIDTELIEMMNDPEYQEEILTMDAEFNVPSWEVNKILGEEDQPQPQTPPPSQPNYQQQPSQNYQQPPSPPSNNYYPYPPSGGQFIYNPTIIIPQSPPVFNNNNVKQ